MRIDAHMHLWRLARGDYDWITPDLAPLRRDFEPEHARPVLDACGIEGAVLVQAAPTVAETRFLLDHAAREPWVKGVVGWADMAAGDAPDVLAQLARDRRLVGIRPMIHDIADLHWMLRRELAPTFRTLVELDLTFDALVRPPHLANLLELLTRHEDLRAVVDHAAKPYIAAGELEPWASEMAALARHTHAFCKLSGLITEAGPGWTAAGLQPYVDVLLETFGPERLVWGSDWPVVTLAGDYRGWHETARRCLAGLDPLALAAVFGGNAARAYRL
jgi:L-fuconolactonase